MGTMAFINKRRGSSMEAAKTQVMLKIVWTDRRAAADDCTTSLAEFLEANADSGPWPEVEALQVGESVQLDWTTVTRIADGSPRVSALPDDFDNRADSSATQDPIAEGPPARFESRRLESDVRS